MRDDSEIQKVIDAELLARRDDERSTLTATIHRGVVRLGGFTASYCEKFAAERAIREIPGVVEVINEIEAHVASSVHPSDVELRCEVLRALQTEVPSVFDRLHVDVHAGEVTLSGSVGCHFLKQRAESAVRRLGTVVTVHNAILLDEKTLVSEVQQRVDALCHVMPGASTAANAAICARVQGNEITLTGSVECSEARALAEQAAWSVPGVQGVRNEIAIQEAPS
jgi:osmotically-inducible protein OsmY